MEGGGRICRCISRTTRPGRDSHCGVASKVFSLPLPPRFKVLQRPVSGSIASLHRAFIVPCVWHISHVVVWSTRSFMFALHSPTFSCSSLVYVVVPYAIDHDMEDETCLYIEGFPTYRVRRLSVQTSPIPRQIGTKDCCDPLSVSRSVATSQENSESDWKHLEGLPVLTITSKRIKSRRIAAECLFSYRFSLHAVIPLTATATTSSHVGLVLI